MKPNSLSVTDRALLVFWLAVLVLIAICVDVWRSMGIRGTDTTLGRELRLVEEEIDPLGELI